MGRATPLLLALLFGSADAAEAQYRRHVEELPPAFGASISVGALFDFDETVSPIRTPAPEEPPHRTIRNVGTVPAVTVLARYGRGIGVYASGTFGFAAEAELSGTDPLTAVPVTGTDDVGLLSIGSFGVTFVPLRDLGSLRLDVGPAWMDLGSGGSYVGLRVAAAATFIEIGDRFDAALAWDGFFAGGQDDQGDVEYQIRGGLISGARIAFGIRL